jgi:hypothetical protein
MFYVSCVIYHPTSDLLYRSWYMSFTFYLKSCQSRKGKHVLHLICYMRSPSLNRTCFAIHNNVRTLLTKIKRGRGGRGRMAVAFTTTCTISTYHHKRCEFESRLWRGVFDTTLCDKSLSATCVGFLRFSPPLKLTATI